MKQFFAIIIVLSSLLALASCRTHTQVVEVPRVSVDTVLIKQWQRDSVWLHDSIFMKEKGDTVWLEKWHTKYKYITKVDTFYEAKVDTITQVVKVPTPVPYTPKLVKLLASLGGLVLSGGLVYGGFTIYKILH